MRLKKQVEEMKPEERVHNMGSLECLLFSQELYERLIQVSMPFMKKIGVLSEVLKFFLFVISFLNRFLQSKGACLGAQCPRIWCVGACKYYSILYWYIGLKLAEIRDLSKVLCAWGIADRNFSVSFFHHIHQDKTLDRAVSHVLSGI